ncbi:MULTISPECIES: DUF1735 and LamG domain-containing protein [Chitinophagaceae]
MKIKNILAGLFALMAVSCSDKKDVEQGSTYSQQAIFYSFKDGVKTQASSATVIPLSATRAEVGTTKEFQFLASLAKINTSPTPITFTVVAAPEAVTQYNQRFGTQYPVFPDSLATLTGTLTIDNGVVTSNIGTVDFKISDSLLNNQPYIYAIQITPSANGTPILSGTQTLLYQIQKTVPVVNTSVALTRDLYMKVETTGSSVADIGTTFTMEGLVYIEKFRDASDVGEAQISTFMGTEGKTLMRFGDASISGNQLQVNGKTIASFSTKQWYHIAAVQTATTTSVYVNGDLVTSFTATGSLGEFYIGRSYSDNRGLWGRVAEIRLWNVARSAQDIKDNMLGVGSSSTGLYAYWKMNDIKDNKIPDETGNGRDLSLWGQGSDPSRKTIKLYNEPISVTIK